MPLAAMSAVYGAAFGLFPIGWLVYSAILLFDVAVDSGCFAAIEQSLRRVSGDQRMLVLLIAFAFGAFIEGTSGFGTPVAVSASLLTALGIPAFTAAGLCLVANTAPVAFGALATPIVTLAGVTGLPLMALSSAVGRLSPIIAFIIPMYLMVLMAGWRGAMGVWPAAVACGVAFGVAQFLVSNFIGPYLTDILSALAAAVALLIAIRFSKPSDQFATPASLASASPVGGSRPRDTAECGASAEIAWRGMVALHPALDSCHHLGLGLDGPVSEYGEHPSQRSVAAQCD